MFAEILKEAAAEISAPRNGPSLAEVRLQCLDRARADYPTATPDYLARVAGEYARFVADGNTYVRVDEGVSIRFVSAAPAYTCDPEPFSEAEVNRIVCGLTL